MAQSFHQESIQFKDTSQYLLKQTMANSSQVKVVVLSRLSEQMI